MFNEDLNTDKYILLMYWVYYELESNKLNLHFNNVTTVENFRSSDVNYNYCLEIHKKCLQDWKYELSNNQMCSGINIFLLINVPELKEKKDYKIIYQESIKRRNETT